MIDRLQSLTIILRCSYDAAWGLTRNHDPNQARVHIAISSLARTSGRWAVEFTTGRPGRSFVLLGELHLLPLHLSRASVTSRRCRIYKRVSSRARANFLLGQVTCSTAFYPPSEVKRSRGIEFFRSTHTRCAQVAFSLARKFPWRYHRVWPPFDSTYSLIIDTYQLLN